MMKRPSTRDPSPPPSRRDKWDSRNSEAHEDRDSLNTSRGRRDYHLDTVITMTMIIINRREDRMIGIIPRIVVAIKHELMR